MLAEHIEGPRGAPQFPPRGAGGSRDTWRVPLKGGDMFDHIGIPVTQFDKSVRFYEAALAPLGFRLEAHDPKGQSAGFGPKGAPAFLLGAGKVPATVHLAFVATTRSAGRQV